MCRFNLFCVRLIYSFCLAEMEIKVVICFNTRHSYCRKVVVTPLKNGRVHNSDYKKNGVSVSENQE